jgi:SAM-dependent methyltransferase
MDPYREIAAYYDCEHGDFHDDIDFYRNLIHVGPVLDVGSGTGRLAEPLARLGLEVWAIDSSAAMLAHARRRMADLPGIHLVEASAHDLDLPARFQVAVVGLNTLWHLVDSYERRRALQTIRKHLVEDGMLVVDLTNPLTMADKGADGTVRCRFSRTCNGNRVTGFSAAWDDEASQILTMLLIYDRVDEASIVHRVETWLTLRYLYRTELELLLQESGFRTAQMYGAYDLEPYGPISPNLIVVATPV